MATEAFSWPTSAGQGALAVEVARDDIAELVHAIDDADTHTTALLERAVLRRLEAGCAAPVGITAALDGADVVLLAEVYALDGTRTVRAERRVPRVDAEAAPEVVAGAVVMQLLAGGAADLADLGGTAQ